MGIEIFENEIYKQFSVKMREMWNGFYCHFFLNDYSIVSLGF